MGHVSAVNQIVEKPVEVFMVHTVDGVDAHCEKMSILTIEVWLLVCQSCDTLVLKTTGNMKFPVLYSLFMTILKLTSHQQT